MSRVVLFPLFGGGSLDDGGNFFLSGFSSSKTVVGTMLRAGVMASGGDRRGGPRGTAGGSESCPSVLPGVAIS